MLYFVPTSACIGGGVCILSVMSLEASFFLFNVGTPS